MTNLTPSSKTRCIIVTGASSGIGKAICSKLLSLGHQVIGIARDINNESHNDKHNFTPHAVDLSKLDLLPDQFRSLSQQHEAVDAIICCAGRGQFGGLEEFSYDQIMSLVSLNFVSQAYICKAFLPALKALEHSNIIFIGSEAALSGSRKGAIYCATKFALRGFAQSLRDECSQGGVHVSIINPGASKTPFFDNLNFVHGSESCQYIETADIVDAVTLILNMRPGTVVEEINLSPLKKVIKSKYPPKNQQPNG